MSTFLFADLAGFTALTEAHGDEEAADVVGDFFARVRDLIANQPAEEVKTIGDAVLLRVDDAAAAVELGLRIAHEVGSRPEFPTVRVGMHTGPAVERGGDWFGATVNVAARVSAEAAGGEVLLTDATLRDAGELEEIEYRDRGSRSFKNVSEPVTLHAAAHGARGEAGLPIDPVCRMAVDPGRGAGSLVYEGRVFHFCSLACVSRFAAAPERYAAGA